MEKTNVLVHKEQSWHGMYSIISLKENYMQNGINTTELYEVGI